MPNAPRICLALAAVLAFSALAGCTTPRAQPKLSQAVIDARAHRDAPPEPACPQTPLSELSPVAAGFAFGEGGLNDFARRALVQPARWLACHPATLAVIKPDADGHGTDAEQNALAQRRGEAVRADLLANGVPAGRVRLLARGAAAPAGEHLLIQAEGRRW